MASTVLPGHIIETPQSGVASLWVVGFAFSAFSSICSALSVVLIRSSHLLNDIQQDANSNSGSNTSLGFQSGSTIATLEIALCQPEQFSPKPEEDIMAESMPQTLPPPLTFPEPAVIWPEQKLFVSTAVAQPKARRAASCSTTPCCSSTSSAPRVPVFFVDSSDYFPSSVTVSCQCVSGSNKDQLPKWWFRVVPHCLSVRQLWFCGMGLASVISPLLSSISVATAPACLVIAMAPLGLVINVVLARVLLNERVAWNEVTGCVLIGVGIAVVLRYASKQTASYAVVHEALCQWTTLLICVGFLVVLLAAVFCSFRLVAAQRAASVENSRRTNAASPSHAILQPMIGVPRQKFPSSRATSTAGIFLSMTAGAACGTTTLSTRVLFTAVEALWGPVAEPAVPHGIGTTIAFALLELIAMATIDLAFMAKSLEFAPAVVASPLRTAFSFAVGTAGSVLILQEIPQKPILFCCAIAAALAGVLCLTLRCWSSTLAVDVYPDCGESRGNAAQIASTV